jgi:hypothetical protein
MGAIAAIDVARIRFVEAVARAVFFAGFAAFVVAFAVERFASFFAVVFADFFTVFVAVVFEAFVATFTAVFFTVFFAVFLEAFFATFFDFVARVVFAITAHFLAALAALRCIVPSCPRSSTRGALPVAEFASVTRISLSFATRTS